MTGCDSGRFALWRLAVTEAWWPRGWRVRLCGWGASTWQTVTQPLTQARLNGVIFTAAHNEYVQMLCEYGLIGLALLCGVLGAALWTCWTGTPDQQAVGLVGTALCVIAGSNFPWSWFHDVQDRRPYAVTVLAVHPQHGVGVQTCPTFARAQGAAKDFVAQGMGTPQVSLWYDGLGPLTASLDDPADQIDRGPKHVGSPALNWLSWLIACLAGG